jgi:hypothetical protein
MAVSGKGPAPREVPYALLTDIPDEEAEGLAVATALSNAATFKRGTLATRPAVGASKEGDIYWATDDTKWGPQGTWYIFYGTEWHEFPQVFKAIISEAIETSMIKGLAVTTPKIAEEAITAAKIAASTITLSRLAGELLGPAAGSFGLRKIGLNALEAMAGNDQRVVHSGEEDVLQKGVVLSTDWKVSALKINAATGELEFTAGGTLWLENEATGGLIRTFIAPKTWKVVPSKLPTTTKWICIGVELAAVEASWMLEPTMSSVAGTELGTEALALTNTAATTAHKTRVVDIPILNTAGVYSLGTARDRRPWAKGGFAFVKRTAGTFELKEAVEVITECSLRMECSGLPVRVRLSGEIETSLVEAAEMLAKFGFRLDGEKIEGTTDGSLRGLNITKPATTGLGGPIDILYDFIPAVGSHLFQATALKKSTATVSLLGTAGKPLTFSVEELRANNNNGIS